MKHFLRIIPFVALIIIFSCKKTEGNDPLPPFIVEDTTVVPGVDPAIANTIDFFLENWEPKSFTAPNYSESAIPAITSHTVTVDASSIITKIPLSEVGQNAL